jgi:hypothetical protein
MIDNFISNAPYNSLFIIYLLISCNFLAQLFSCQLQQLLANSMLVKHIFGFTTMLFCIIFVDSTIQKEGKYAEGLAYAIIFYLWFWATTKTHLYVTLIIIILFLIIYSLQIHKNTLDQEENINEISNYQKILALSAFIVTIFGFIQYYLLKSEEYKNNWNYTDFFIGTSTCKNNNSINEFIPTNLKNDSNSNSSSDDLTVKN